MFNNSKSSANNINLVQPKGLHVSNDRVWVGNAKNSVQEFDISGGAMTWVDEMGTSAISRALPIGFYDTDRTTKLTGANYP